VTIYTFIQQGNRRYQTSPAFCNPTTSFTADKPHLLLPELFRILFALAWHTEWSLLLHDAISDWMIPLAANATATLQRPLPILLNGSDNPRKLPLFLGGSAPPSNTWFRGPPSLHSKRHVDRFSRFCTAHGRMSHYFKVSKVK